MDNNTKFNYQSKDKKFVRAFKRTVGMHLFYQRQKRKIQTGRVCQSLNISQKTLDKIELGKGQICWDTIEKLMKLYHIKMKVDFYYSPDIVSEEKVNSLG